MRRLLVVIAVLFSILFAVENSVVVYAYFHPKWAMAFFDTSDVEREAPLHEEPSRQYVFDLRQDVKWQDVTSCVFETCASTERSAGTVYWYAPKKDRLIFVTEFRKVGAYKPHYIVLHLVGVQPLKQRAIHMAQAQTP